MSTRKSIPKLDDVRKLHLSEIRRMLKERSISNKGSKLELTNVLFDILSNEHKDSKAQERAASYVSVDKLREKLAELGAPTTGTKKEMTLRIKEYEVKSRKEKLELEKKKTPKKKKEPVEKKKKIISEPIEEEQEVIEIPDEVEPEPIVESQTETAVVEPETEPIVQDEGDVAGPGERIQPLRKPAKGKVPKKKRGRPRKYGIGLAPNGVEPILMIETEREKKRKREMFDQEIPLQTVYSVPDQIIQIVRNGQIIEAKEVRDDIRKPELSNKKKRGRKPKPIAYSDFETVAKSVFGDMAKRDKSKITSIDFHGQKINTLNGIEQFKQLKRIVLSGNNISDLSLLSGLTELEELWLCSNEITNLEPLLNLNLKVLSLAKNPLRDLTPLVSLSHLKYLNLAGCSLAEISTLDGLNDLIELNLNSNELTDVTPVSSLINLKTLALKDNKVKNLDCLKVLNLRELYTRGNGLKDIDSLRTMLHYQDFVNK